MMRELTLPDGLTVFSLNPDETRFLYRGVFEQRSYLRHGAELHDGDCVFDVGAHIGLASLFFHQERKGVRIFAFEPSPAPLECLKANIARHGVDARIFEFGLWSTAGTVEFTFYPANTVMSGFHAHPAMDRETTRTYMVNSGISPRGADRFTSALFRSETLTCPVRTLSEVIDAEQVERIDLLKLHVEKSEGEVLAGIRPEHWPRIHQVAMEVYDENNGVRQVQALMQEQGFRVTIEQDPLLRGTPVFAAYAVRAQNDVPSPGATRS